MQTTQSELPGPSTGVGADGVTGVPGVPGVSGGLGIWMFEVLGKNRGGEGDGAEGVTSTSASCLVTLQGPSGLRSRAQFRRAFWIPASLMPNFLRSEELMW